MPASISKNKTRKLRFFNKSGFNAVGANTHPFGLAVLNGPNLLQIWIPNLFGLIMGVTYIITYLRFFSTYLAYF